LPEFLQIIKRQRFARGDIAMRIDRSDSRQMDHRIEEHRCMTARQNESVPIGPQGVCRIVAEDLGPKLECDRCQGHRGPGVSAIGRLDTVHAQRADRVDGQLSEGGGGNGHNGPWESS